MNKVIGKSIVFGNNERGVVVGYGAGVFFGWVVVQMENGLKRFIPMKGL